MTPSRRAVAKTELDEKMGDFLAGGGKITRCAPGPSEGVVYRSGNRRWAKPQSAPAAEPVNKDGGAAAGESEPSA